MSGHGRNDQLLISFEPDPDYSPDAGNGLLSPISYALQRGILLRRENPTYRYWAAATHGLQWFLSRVSILTRDIDIANLSVCPSVRNVPVSDENGLTHRHSFFTIRQPNHSVFISIKHLHEIPTGSPPAGR